MQKKISNTILSGSGSKPLLNDLIIPMMSVQQQMMVNWNPVHPHNQNKNPIPPIFQGATINNCHFNINININPVSTCENPPKRRRIVIEDDSQ